MARPGRSPASARLLVGFAAVAASACGSSSGPSPAAERSSTSAAVPAGIAEAITLVEEAAGAARERSYTATYQVGEDPDSSAQVYRRPGQTVFVLAGTTFGDDNTAIGSMAAPISLYVRVHPGTTFVACGTESGATRCYDFAPLLDAERRGSREVGETPVLGRRLAHWSSCLPSVLSVEAAVFEEIAAELRRSPSDEEYVISVQRRSSGVGELRCLAAAESQALLVAGASEGFCVNADSVRATAVDASDSFASNLVAYEPMVDAGVFRLPVPVEPLPASAPR